jgi:hypothetical protein
MWSLVVGLVRNHLQIGATNTNVDDGVNPLACVTLPLAAANLLGELLDVLEDFVDALDDAVAIDLHLLVGGVAESYMVDCAVLGEVDLLTSEHVIAKLLNAGLLGELDKELHGLLSDEVLGEVEQDLGSLGIVLEGVAELLEPLQQTWSACSLCCILVTYLGVVLEVLLKYDVLSKLLVVVLEGRPGVQV